ncbi:head-to-tail connector protein [Mycobacterium phage BobSwaget]|nr:head-to-tail connector protein [Mycobacterium phage BobSwaget]ASW31366.1 head-to-tail connector protein [Mycobacterium phage Lokk]QDF18417.1 hypothetical protein SEA_RACHALY_22 [Mycobacterium Phage Rachaly]QGH78716.1 hypothetical protein SEA_MIKO_22 [Mycobacterium phage Miko]
MSGEEYQPKAPYPSTFLLAVPPGEVTTAGCDHEADPPVCTCVHDWRIEWQNMPKRAARRNLFVTDSP